MPRPRADEMQAAAAQCNIPVRFLRIGNDEDGDFADISPQGDLDHLQVPALLCLIRWAEQHGARIGFLSEPPPGPEAIAFGPIASVRAAARAARACGLPVHVDPVSEDEAVLMARRNAPARELACTLSWIAERRGALGFRPIPDFAN